MAAWTDKAGRDHNEDNFQLQDNLDKAEWGFRNDEVALLGEKGALLVVCDGMGGMSAGEVASKLAVEAIRECFSAEQLTQQVMATPETITRYIEKAIIAADEKIKDDGRRNRERDGMGSTIVLAWIVEDQVYVGWCGDSRAYRYNPAFEPALEQLSHDHSYVQDLVDSGKLQAKLAFDHPDSNIITRSLGDTRQKARPDVERFPLYDGDIIMLCSDGLSGVLRDEEMQDVIAENADSMDQCRKALWTASENAGWTDNVTVALCQILSGAGTAPKSNQAVEANTEKRPEKTAKQTKQKRLRRKQLWVAVLVAAIIAGIAFEATWYWRTGKWAFPACKPGDRTEEKQTEKDEYEDDSIKDTGNGEVEKRQKSQMPSRERNINNVRNADPVVREGAHPVDSLTAVPAVPAVPAADATGLTPAPVGDSDSLRGKEVVESQEETGNGDEKESENKK